MRMDNKQVSGLTIVLAFFAIGTAIMAAAAVSPKGAGGPGAGQEPPSEWTFEQAVRCWAPMARAVQHVGVPGYQFQAGVTWDGALVFGPLAFLESPVIQQETAPLGKYLLHVSFGYGDPMALVDRKGTNDPRIRRSLESAKVNGKDVRIQAGDVIILPATGAAASGKSSASAILHIAGSFR